MRLPLRQYRQAHKGDAFPLVQLHRYIIEHGAPDMAALLALSERLALPVPSIRSAISYYSDLHEKQESVRVCKGTSCMLAGADGLQQRIAASAPCGNVYCLGYCDRSPAVLRPDGRVLIHCDASANQDLLTSRQPISDPPSPLIRSTMKEPIVTRNVMAGEFSQIEAARARGIYSAAEHAMRGDPQAILNAVEQSGERGRGGAGFPTAAKWRACAVAASDEKYVIANGDEGDPGSFIDRVLMEQDPHSIIEGMIICARAVGAHRGVMFIRSEYPRAIERVSAAIDAARGVGILGPSVMESGFAFDLTVFPGMGSYVCGEETAMLNTIEGFRGEVRLRPPFPATDGLHGKPTIVNNVETLINIPWIIERGAQAYRALGTKACSGSKALCINHGFARPGIAEVEFGLSLREVIHDLAGGGRDGQPLEAVLLGGPMGSVLTSEQWDAPVCYQAMARRGIQLGHGGLVAVPRGTDFRMLLRHWLQFMQRESCGKCVPCAAGSRRALELIENHSGTQNVDQFTRLLEVMSAASLCAFGQEMPRPMQQMLERFGDRIFPRGGAT